jgi:hypothetical protein
MRTRIRARRLGAFAAALALAAVMPACGGGGGGTTPSTLPPAPQPTRTQIQSGGFSVVGTDEAQRNGFNADVAVAPVNISAAGTVEIVADWTFASNDVDVFWFAGSCSPAQAVRGQCTVIAAEQSSTLKPERLTLTNVAAGSYTVGFANFGRTTESGNYQIFLTR